MTNLTQKRVVLITGASGGIGLATARALAAPGTRLFLAGRRAEPLQSAAAELQAIPLLADLADSDAVAHMADVVRRDAGHLDLLVNCAGQLEVGPAEQLGVAVAEQLIRVNYLGAIRVIHACLPLLRKGRHPVIVNVSSFAGRVAPPYMAAYAASKFALNGYSHALRQELRPEGIHVGLVLPGPVDTPMVHGRLGGAHYPLPRGVPTLRADRVAKAILAVIEQRVPEAVVPWRLTAAGRLGAAYPALVDRLYARLQAAHKPPVARRSD